MYIKYAPAVLLFLLIAGFYLGLPTLSSCILPKYSLETENASFHRKSILRHILICGIITTAYAFTGFYGLGNRTAPESIVELHSGDSAVIELSDTVSVDRITIFSVINTGTIDIQYSEDGTNWYAYASFSQNYASLLKWNDITFSPAESLSDNPISTATAKYIKLICISSSPRLGEIGIYTGDKLLDCSCSDAPALCDEQNIVPFEQTYKNSSYFDEIYHARTADEYIEGITPYEVSHPPLGKAIISIGIMIFGLNPFGWRFMGTLFGVLMLPLLYLFTYKMFRRISVAAVCTIIFAFDFMHFTQTRLATIDTYAVFFIIAMYLFLYLYSAEPASKKHRVSNRVLYLFFSGLCFGLGCACKWTCVYAGIGLAVIWLLDHVYRRKEESVKDIAINICQSTLFFVIVPVIIYYLSYYPYGSAAGLKGIGAFFTREYFDIVFNNQKFMFSYHSGLIAEHPYSSKWYQWIFDIRPILYYLKYDSNGMRSSFGAFVSPMLCWGGIIAFAVLIYGSFIRKCKTASFIIIGYLSQLLPWVFIERLTFEYHYFPCTIFLTLAIGYCLSIMRENRLSWKLYLWGTAVISIVLFVLFYPVLSGYPVNADKATLILRWLPTWPF